ncbi:hypothetical protein C8J27_10390 [Rhodobacter aestuarii]|uniref:Uncharacterized protein n=1 Tax=Rhodobacter aestuarii TaxID=453582 RepID=A0A1N7KCI6_9RHOB|nr:hypothetical protein [Rhodobacter aestuarii]PTV95762.1 hypothetical protein C8J27_10390 [Rhodobacter aestuarii]SIS59263.1 hypothetical protein SAMN05421580_102344 [Rhodobacter aestuarii]
MSKMQRDEVLNYRPGKDSELPLEPGERVAQIFLADQRRYYYDHLVLGGIGAVLVSAVLIWLEKYDQVLVAVIAIIVGMALRAIYFRSEAFARRWQLTDRRLIGPQGRQVMLLEIETVRSLMGDVQIVTKTGAKHLIRHLADAAPVVTAIEAAKTRRAKVVK